MRINYYHYKREAKQNPYIGFTSFQHFRNDELYSDLIVKPENNMTETEHVECYPIPAYVKQEGRKEGYYPDCSVVYIRILWKEFEPKQGEYNYAFIEEILQKARENEQTLMFRLMPHSTRETDDVPDWLKEKIDCPARPIGERVKMSPTSPLFLEYFGTALRKIGERFDGDPAFGFLDISLPGSWGEGSSVDLFTEEQIEDFVNSYICAFPNTRLIGQMAPLWLLEKLNEKSKAGWRADCIGKPHLTYEYVRKTEENFPTAWQRGHVSFESYWWLGEWQRQGWDLDNIIQTTLDWHVSTFNAKSLPIPWEWKDKIDAWVDKMGYHFVIDSFACPERSRCGETVRAVLGIDNVGVAPIYHEMPLYVRLTGEAGDFEMQTDADVRTWLPGKGKIELDIPLPKHLKAGEYEVELGLGGGEHPKAYFATDAELNGHYARVGKILIKDE